LEPGILSYIPEIDFRRHRDGSSPKAAARSLPIYLDFLEMSKSAGYNSEMRVLECDLSNATGAVEARVTDDGQRRAAGHRHLLNKCLRDRVRS
jgi:hypothetical protein